MGGWLDERNTLHGSWAVRYMRPAARVPRHDPARSTGPPAEERTVRTSKATRAETTADGDELESWLHDLVGGEPSARRYRERLRAEGETPEAASTGTYQSGLDGHERHSA